MSDDHSDEPGYAASYWMAAVITDIDRLGLLQGDLRTHVASTLEVFRTQGKGGADPEKWHTDLYDFYEELHGHPPEPR